MSELGLWNEQSIFFYTMVDIELDSIYKSPVIDFFEVFLYCMVMWRYKSAFKCQSFGTPFFFTDVAKPSGANGQGTVRGPKPMGSFTGARERLWEWGGTSGGLMGIIGFLSLFKQWEKKK